MSLEITNQFRFLLLSLCMGMALMTGYDVLRFFRFLIAHSSFWIWAEELFYWCLVSVPVFYVFLRFHQGIIRWYGIVALCGGAVLYEFGISRVVRNWGNAFFLPKKQKIGKKLKLWRKRAASKWKHVFCADFTKKIPKRKKYCKTGENRL